ncbi:MAG: aconitate hydratase [Cycloclasticus sp. symbiont of Poecilosclerida sp. M]|nr:MAG: aconitate hydratase [Cycloclasticus sp. symbiont of Poecilosclerida sp. M]
MIRLLLLIAIVFGAIYLVRWFITTPTKTVAAHIRKTLWLTLGLGLIFLALTGRLNIIFAFIGSAIPILVRHVPNILRLLGLAKSIQSARANNPPPAQTTQKMDVKEALDVLGLKLDATEQEIIYAHKRLMQKVHPDKGGTPHLAAKLNQAKDILLDTTK